MYWGGKIYEKQYETTDNLNKMAIKAMSTLENVNKTTDSVIFSTYKINDTLVNVKEMTKAITHTADFTFLKRTTRPNQSMDYTKMEEMPISHKI